MKKKLAIAGLVTMIIICMAITYRNLAPVQDDGYRSARERAVIKKFDKTGDGELSWSEEKEAEEAIEAVTNAVEEQMLLAEEDEEIEALLDELTPATASANGL